MKANRIVHLVLVISVLVPASSALAQCPPDLFDYGPVLAPNAERIVLDRYGPHDPLIPAPGDYQRVAQDVDLILAAVPILEDQLHAVDFALNRIAIRTDTPASVDLVCANTFYQAALAPIVQGWWNVIFPRSINPHAAAAIYGAIPGVQTAEAVPVFSGFCSPDSWLFQILPADIRRWDIQAFPDGLMCRPLGRWTILTTPGGQITILCYANCDQSIGAQQLSANDFLCFLNRFAAEDAYANCDQSTGTPSLTPNDFQCFLNQFAAGCT